MDTKMKLSEHQIKALNKMHNGCILCGDTGSGNSPTMRKTIETKL